MEWGQLLSRVQLFATHEPHHARPSPTPGIYPNSRPLSQWCHLIISSSVIDFSSFPQSFPTSGSFPESQLFAWGGQSTAVSASTSVLPMNTQAWSPLGWTGWISLHSKGCSRVFSNTTVQKHQFCTQLSLFFLKIYFSWRLITLQYCSGFCHTLVWISHGFTYVQLSL